MLFSLALPLMMHQQIGKSQIVVDEAAGGVEGSELGDRLFQAGISLQQFVKLEAILCHFPKGFWCDLPETLDKVRTLSASSSGRVIVC